MPLAALAVPFLIACKLREECNPPLPQGPPRVLAPRTISVPRAGALIGQPESRPSVFLYACGSEAVNVTTQPETLAAGQEGFCCSGEARMLVLSWASQA